MAEYRMVPIKRLISRLNLEPFYHEAPMTALNWQPEQVSIPLLQHIGAPAEACVQMGDFVNAGQCIAQPKADALSVGIHASIAGHITQITPNSITISRG